MNLEDILTGSRCTVSERSASTLVRRGGVLYARIVTMDGISIMVGSGAIQLPPLRRADVADFRDQLSRRRGHLLTDAEVLALDDALRRWYCWPPTSSVTRPRRS